MVFVLWSLGFDVVAKSPHSRQMISVTFSDTLPSTAGGSRLPRPSMFVRTHGTPAKSDERSTAATDKHSVPARFAARVRAARTKTAATRLLIPVAREEPVRSVFLVRCQ